MPANIRSMPSVAAARPHAAAKHIAPHATAPIARLRGPCSRSRATTISFDETMRCAIITGRVRATAELVRCRAQLVPPRRRHTRLLPKREHRCAAVNGRKRCKTGGIRSAFSRFASIDRSRGSRTDAAMESVGFGMRPIEVGGCRPVEMRPIGADAACGGGRTGSERRVAPAPRIGCDRGAGIRGAVRDAPRRRVWWTRRRPPAARGVAGPRLGRSCRMEAEPRFELGIRFANRCLSHLAMPPKRRGRGGRWSGKRDSNPRRPPWQGGALPTELFPLDGPPYGTDPAPDCNPRVRSDRCGSSGAIPPLAARRRSRARPYFSHMKRDRPPEKSSPNRPCCNRSIASRSLKATSARRHRGRERWARRDRIRAVPLFGAAPIAHRVRQSPGPPHDRHGAHKRKLNLFKPQVHNATHQGKSRSPLRWRVTGRCRIRWKRRP